ncbi:N-acetyl-beta-D-galactosaminidase [Aureococcus anophagefferens]|nr:N-acetyl-beta-D-galactosaminidase [Aureococcus anophagefferens]
MMFAWAALVLALPLARAANTPLASGTSISGLGPKHGASAAGATALGSSRASASSPRRRRRGCDAPWTARGLRREPKTLWTHQTRARRAARTHRRPRPDDGAPPAYGDDETFELVIAPGAGSLRAASFAGALRGLEAFAQCTVRLGAKVVVNSTLTNATGAAPVRVPGVMVDSSRHFLPVPTLEAILDGMAASALNVLHWHLVDAQSFPWNASFEPALVRGAYRPDLAYQRADLERVVAYAGDRAIRVIPEIDVPGHSAAVAVGRPDLVVACGAADAGAAFDGSRASGTLLDPLKEETYAFLGALFAELRGVFRDAAVHLGGDEVQFRCLNASADFRGRMVARGYDASCPAADPPKTGGNVCANGGPGFKKVVGDFVVRAQRLARAAGFEKLGGWQEIFDHYGGDDATTPTPPVAGLDPGTAIYAWLAPSWGWGNPASMAARGFDVVSTLGLYLGSDADHGDWRAFYDVHPRSSATRNASSRGYFNVTDPAEACSDETMSSRMSMLACACASEFDESAARREERKEDASQGLVVPELPDVAAAFDSAVFAREAESRPDLQRSGSSRRRGKRRGKGESAVHRLRRAGSEFLWGEERRKIHRHRSKRHRKKSAAAADAPGEPPPDAAGAAARRRGLRRGRRRAARAPGWYPDPYPRHNHGEHYVIHTLDKMRRYRIARRLLFEHRDAMEASNVFDVYGSPEPGGDERRLFVVTESSKTWNRVCFRPHHSLLLHVEHPSTREVFLTLERPGMEGCCASAPRGGPHTGGGRPLRDVRPGPACCGRCAANSVGDPEVSWGGPKPWLFCCPCGYRCQHELYAQRLWLDAHPSNHLGHVFQPDALEQLMLDGSPLSPMLELRTRRGDVLGVLEGPCWGGCCCGDPAFEYKASPSALLPRAASSTTASATGRATTMLLDFHDGEPGDGGATIAVPASRRWRAALLGHYAYFHHNRPGCELKGKPEGWRGPRCTLCAWSLFGHVCPCTSRSSGADCHCARKLAKTRDDVDARLEQSEFHYARTRNPPPTRTSVFRRRASSSPTASAPDASVRQASASAGGGGTAA